MEIKITYDDRNLIIQGDYIRSGINSWFYESFDITSIICNDINVFDDYDLDQQLDIEKLCIKAIKS